MDAVARSSIVPPSDGSPSDVPSWGALPDTLGAALRRMALTVPDAPALLSEARCLTWGEVDREVDRLAGLLLEVGVRPGEAIGFLITKRPEVVTGFLAAARIGAIMAPINFKMVTEQVLDQLETASIRTLFVEGAFDGLLRTLLPVLPDPARIIYVDGPGRHGTSHSQQARGGPPVGESVGAPLRLEGGFVPSADSPCYYNYTSGTTGRPKGAITTHRMILHNAAVTIEGLGFRPTDVFLGMFSVFAHPHELFHRSLLVGGPFVILDTLSPRVVAATVERFRVTWMMAVPSFYEMMLDYAAPSPTHPRPVVDRLRGAHKSGDTYDLSSLRILESGGAFVGSDTLERMEQSFAGATFLPVWGCTEATGVALANGPGPERRPGATGRLVPGHQMRVVDDHGRDVPPGEVGELLVSGPGIVDGYVNNPDETSALFKDGWYSTRDLVRADEAGFVWFVGRRSEMLKIGGIRVYPLEIEKIIKAHPDVRDVVVVRAEERVRGEIARAVISTVPGSRLDSTAVQRYCRERMAVYKVPRIVEFWREVPKLPNGKIDKVAVVVVPADPDRDERT
jgi:long-chain acyl-CoA synthetase